MSGQSTTPAHSSPFPLHDLVSMLPSLAEAPFDDKPLADLVIVTSDNVEFYLLKGILMVASPFFRDMFSLVQPAKEHVSVELDRVPISENKETFDTLIRLCYPVDDPVITDTPLLEKVLEAAMKYQMLEATKILNASLRGFIQEKPLSVYAVACRLELEWAALLAAKQWQSTLSLTDDMTGAFKSSIAGGSYIPEMATIASGAYHRLLHFLRGNSVTTFTSPAANLIPCPPTSSYSSIPRNTVGVDVVLCSSDGVRFPVHSAVLRVALADSLLGDYSCAAKGCQGPTEITVDITSSILNIIIDLCYPFALVEPECENLTQLLGVLEGAEKFKMRDMPVTAAAKRLIMRSVKTQPLSVYFIASIKGWHAEAQEAVRQVAVNGTSTTYVSEMEIAPASVYHRLLAFQHQYATSVQTAVQSAVPGCDSPWQLFTGTQQYQSPMSAISPPFVGELVKNTQALLQKVRSRASNPSYCFICDAWVGGGRVCATCRLALAPIEGLTASLLLEQSRQLEAELKTVLSELMLAEPQV